MIPIRFWCDHDFKKLITSLFHYLCLYVLLAICYSLSGSSLDKQSRPAHEGRIFLKA